ncbi:MAG: hypothetical protein LBN36_09285, partial [Clostridiales Family XIII bacterium]|nr:hypothetical protein [Clostridiales Family XIII bacterium]
MIMDQNEIQILTEENRLLARENKKLQRTLARHEEFIQRNKVSLEARKQFNDIVKSERSRLELNMNLLLTNIRDYILFFDTAGKIQYCSDSFLRAINVPGFPLIKDKRMSEILTGIIPQENIDQIIQMAHDFSEGAPFYNLAMSLRADLDRSGNLRDYLVEVNILITDQGGSEGFFMLFYDTTDLMDARREAEKANSA